MKKLFATAAVSALISSSVLASSAEKFSALDADKDGFISVSEAKEDAKLSASFKGLDTDGNGQLAWSEYSSTEKAVKAEKAEKSTPAAKKGM